MPKGAELSSVLRALLEVTGSSSPSSSTGSFFFARTRPARTAFATVFGRNPSLRAASATASPLSSKSSSSFTTFLVSTAGPRPRRGA